MSLTDAFSFLIVFFFTVWFLRSIIIKFRAAWYKLQGVFPHAIDFALRDVPLSSEQWKRFCALAHARGISQKRLLADMIVFYFERKVNRDDI